MQSVKLLAVANPFVSAGGGPYRAKKSLIEYPRRGIEPYLLVPPVERDFYDEREILELAVKGVKIVGFLGFTSGSLLSRRAREALYPVIPRLLIPVSVRERLMHVDVVVSFDKPLEMMWPAYFLASKLEKPAVAVLQTPAFYASKHRREAIYQAMKLHYSSVYEGSAVRKALSYAYRLYRRLLDNLLYAPRYKRLLSEFDLVVGISKAVCVEMGLEESSRVHCMDPGVTLDEGDLRLIESVRSKFKEKKNYVVFGGRPDFSKGVAEALLAFREISRRLSGYKLYVTGRLGSREAARLSRLAKRLGISDKVVFTGFVPREENLRIVREAKLMLYPSHVDSFSYAVAESLLLRTPVVAYDIPAIEIYYRGIDGVRIVRELDIGALVDAALDILHSNRVSTEAPRLRPWSQIIEEEISLIKSVASLA